MLKKILAAVVMTAAGVGAVDAAPGPGGPGGPGGGPGGPGGPGGRAGRGGAPASLGSAMRDMGTVYKRIKGEYTDATKMEATLADITTMERDVAVAKAGLPDNVNAKSGEEKLKSAKEYRGMMRNLLKKFIDLEQAVTDSKADDAKAALADIDKMMEAGHKEFMPQQ